MGRDERRILRVLAADDSAVMRGVLRTVFDLHAGSGSIALPPMELCAVVKDGEEALEAIARLHPDVLLLDLEMPRLNGIGVLERLRKAGSSLPVIMCSAYTARGARSTLDALSHGAHDYVMKPGQQVDFAAALDALSQELLPKIAALATPGENPSSLLPLASGKTWSGLPAKQDAPMNSGFNAVASKVQMVVIGLSTGGPSALETMLPGLPKDFPAPVMIVQHMPKLFTNALAERLDRLCTLPVAQAREGTPIKPGTILLAPGDAHMEIAPETASGRLVVSLHQQAPLNSCIPSVDYLFHSAARWCGAGTLAIVMTGMGSDGLDGARAIQQAGGRVLAQDQETSAVWGMPRRVWQEGVAAELLPLEELAGALVNRVQRGREWRASNVQDPLSAPHTRREAMYGVL